MGRNILFREIGMLSSYGGFPADAAAGNGMFENEVPYPDDSRTERAALDHKTLYLKTDLGVEEKVPKLTGVYLPVDFSRQNQIDAIIYFHGLITGGRCHGDAGEFRKNGVAYYWQYPAKNQTTPFFALREGLKNAARRAILIVPTLGTNAESDFGKLAQGAFFDQYLNRILETLKNKNLIPKDAGWRNIILAGHSAGGNLLQKLVGFSRSAYLKNIQECWALDCFYYGYGGWKQWFKKKDPQQRFVAFYTGSGSSAKTAQALENYAKNKVRNVSVKKSWDHCAMVPRVWQRIIEETPFLEKY